MQFVIFKHYKMFNDQEVAKILLEKKAVRIDTKKPFVFTSGIHSPIYVDNRLLISYPKEREKIIKKLTIAIDEFGGENVVLSGTATAAIPWAAFLAQYLKLPMVYVRPKPKEHGTGKQVEGDIPANSNVLVVEDMISTGGSSLGTIEALKRECQANVLGVVAIYSHTLKTAQENFKEAGVEARYLTDFTTVVEMAVAEKYIKEDDKETVLRWREEGREWGINMGFIKRM